MQVLGEGSGDVVGEAPGGSLATAHAVHQDAECVGLARFGAEDVAREGDYVVQGAGLGPDDARGGQIAQATAEGAFLASDGEGCQELGADPRGLVNVVEEGRDVGRRDEVAIKEPGAVDEGRAPRRDACALEDLLEDFGSSGGGSRARALGAEDLDDHFGGEVVAHLAHRVDHGGEGRRGARGQERRPGRGGADAHPTADPEAGPAESLDHAMAREVNRVGDAAPIAHAEDALGYGPTKAQGQLRAISALVGDDVRGAPRGGGGDAVVDLEISVAAEANRRRRAFGGTGYHAQYIGAAFDRGGRDGGPEGRDLAGLLLEGRGQHLVVEVGAVDDHRANPAHPAVFEGLGELDEIAHPEGRVSEASQHQVLDDAPFDAPVEAGEHREVGAELEEGSGGGDHLHVGGRIEGQVFVIAEDLAASRGVDDVDADAVTEARFVDQGAQPSQKGAGLLGRAGGVAEGQPREGKGTGQGQRRKGSPLHGAEPITRMVGLGPRLSASLMVLLAFLMACGGQAQPDANDEDVLTVVLPRDAEQLDPRFVGDPYGLKVTRLIFASIITIDPRSLDVVPDLAVRVEAETPVRYRVELRPGLRFSDGSALDADDVIATFRSVVDPDLGSRYASTYRRIRRMDRVDELTVVFHLTAPHATFITDLELPVMRAEDTGAQVGGEGRPPIGAGPYRLTHRAPGQLRLEANPHWHAGVPTFPRVRMVVVRDDNTRALRLLAGAGDLALNTIPPLLVPLFEEDDRFTVRTAPGVGTSYLGFNTSARPFDDLRVRRAVAHAIDREALVEAKLGGRATLARGWIPPGHWAYEEDVETYGYDPARSRALLDEAGFPDPDGPGGEPRMTIAFRTSSDRFRSSVARAVSAMLADVGIHADVRPSETATMIADLNHGRFQMTFLQVPEVFEPHVLSWFFASERIPEDGEREGANRWRIHNAALDAAFERGRANADRETRIAAYAEAQRILAAELPVVPLWHEDVVAIIGPRAEAYDVPRDARLGTLAR